MRWQMLRHVYVDEPLPVAVVRFPASPWGRRDLRAGGGPNPEGECGAGGPEPVGGGPEPPPPKGGRKRDAEGSIQRGVGGGGPRGRRIGRGVWKGTEIRRGGGLFPR